MNEFYFVHGDADLTNQFRFTCSKFNIRNTRTRFEICSKLTLNTPERRGFSSPYFPAFGQNAERYGVSLLIQSECGKYGLEKSRRSGVFNINFEYIFIP